VEACCSGCYTSTVQFIRGGPSPPTSASASGADGDKDAMHQLDTDSDEDDDGKPDEKRKREKPKLGAWKAQLKTSVSNKDIFPEEDLHIVRLLCDGPIRLPPRACLVVLCAARGHRRHAPRLGESGKDVLWWQSQQHSALPSVHGPEVGCFARGVGVCRTREVHHAREANQGLGRQQILHEARQPRCCVLVLAHAGGLGECGREPGRCRCATMH